MAQRWTHLIIICLTILATLITAFRVRDFPKSSHDSAKIQESCEHCDVKNGNNWHSGVIDSDKYVESRKDREKLKSDNNKAEVKSSNKKVQTDDDDDNDDFSFLKFDTGFIQEYPKEALNKLEEKLEIISKSFWNLFGDDYSDVEVDDEEKGEVVDDDIGEDDYEYDNNDDERLKIPNKLEKLKVINKHKEIESNNIKSQFLKQPEVNQVSNGNNKIKIGNKIKPKFTETKGKTEIPRQYIRELRIKKSRMSEDDEKDDDYTENQLSDEETDNKVEDIGRNEGKTSSTFAPILQKQISSDSSVNSENRNHKNKTVLKRVTETVSKRLEIKTNLKSRLKDWNKIAYKGVTSDKDDYTSTYDGNYESEEDDNEDEYNRDNDLKDNDDSENNEEDDNNDDDDDYKVYEESDDKNDVGDDINNDSDIEEDEDVDGNDKVDNNKNDLKDDIFATKISGNIKEAVNLIDITVEENSKEMKNKESIRLKPVKELEIDKDISNKSTTKLISKIQTNQIIISKTSLENLNKQNNEDSKKLVKNQEFKNAEVIQEFRKPEQINEFDSKTEKQHKVRTSKSDQPTQQTAKKDELKIIKNDEVKSKKESGKVAYDGIKTKTSRDKNINKILEAKKTFKIDTTDQKRKKGELEHSLKKEIIKDKDSTEQFIESHEADSKGQSNLKHITDALHRRTLHKSVFEDFYTFLPTFAPNFSRVHNPECRRHGQIMLRQLRGTKLWALNMLDATAKIPSGLLQGNGIQLGDFEQCLASRARVQLDTGSVVKIQGKYCLAWIDIRAEHSELEAPVHLAQAKNLIKSRIDDPGHFVPRFSTLSWGVCVPSPCEAEDVEVILRDAVRHYQRTTGIVVRIKVNEGDCHIDQGADIWEKWLELPTVLTLSFYGVVIVLVCVATVQDYVSRKQTEEVSNTGKTNDTAERDRKETKTQKEDSNKQEDLLSIFSLYRTMKKLTSPGSTDDISCIHGVRAIATIALLIAHKFLPVAAIPYNNRLKITEMVTSALWSWCRAGWIFTDCFLLLSGTLSAYKICTNTDSGAPKRLLLRYLKLTPALLAVVLFYAYIWDNISTGPMWGTYITKNVQVCQEGWWWNLLYVQNYFGFENMCAPQTHQLALDMQLTIIGGIIVWLVQEKRGFTKLIIPAIQILATYSRYITVRDHRLTMLAYHGVSVSQLYRTARLSYTSVFHRSTPYLVGITLGIALKKPSQHGKFFLTVGWIISGVLWSLVWWAGFDSGSTNYRFNVTSAAQYAALTPIASAVSIAWVIYAVHGGCSEILSRLLCLRPLVIISRLSYAIYLCQFIIYLTNVGTVKKSSEFTLTTLFDVQELAAIILLSTIITLTLVIPLQSLHKFLFISQTERVETKIQKMDTVIKNKPLKDLKRNIKADKVTPQIKPMQKIVVHRELLKEISEAEMEYELQRDRSEALEGILEEEENEEEMGEEEYLNHLDDDLVIINENEEESWSDRENEPRTYSREEDNELDEWEWTANNRNGAQYIRYSR